jgi:hypothetical protein
MEKQVPYPTKRGLRTYNQPERKACCHGQCAFLSHTDVGILKEELGETTSAMKLFNY